MKNKKISKFDDELIIDEPEEETPEEDNIKNGEFVIKIDGEIGYDITADSINKQLEKANGQDVVFEVSSPGGSVFEGVEIFNLIRNYEGNTEARIMGIAASMASYIPLATDKVLAEDNATYMIHNAWGFAMGDSEEMKSQAEILENINNTLAQEYVKKTGKSEKEILQLMANETWLFGEEIKKEGFIDEIIVHGKSDKNKNSKEEAIIAAKNKFKSTLDKKDEIMKSDLKKMKNKLDLESSVGKKMAKFVKWSKDYKSKLPDDAFVIVSGKDKNKVRKLAFKDHNGKVDVPHLRNAIIRLSQGKFKLSVKEKYNIMAKLKNIASKYLENNKSISAKIMTTAISKFETNTKDKLMAIISFLKEKSTNRKPDDELNFEVKRISLLIQDLEDCVELENERLETIKSNQEMIQSEEKRLAKEKNSEDKVSDKKETIDEVEKETEIKDNKEVEETKDDKENTKKKETKVDELDEKEEISDEADDEIEEDSDIEVSKFQELIKVCEGFKSELDKNNKLISKFKEEIKVHIKDKSDLKQELSKFKEEKYITLLDSTVNKVSKFKRLNETDKLKLKQEYLTSKMSDSALEELGRITEEKMFSKLEEPKETTKPSSELTAAEEPREFSKMSKSEQLDQIANANARKKGFVIK